MSPRKEDTPDRKDTKMKKDKRSVNEQPELSKKDEDRPQYCCSSVHTNLPVSKVIVHPLVLLSVVDHFNRISKTQKVKRVVGVLLGSFQQGKVLSIANSFAVPFDEDDKDEQTWFVDMDYLESMYTMFHKVAARERIVGWYHTGPNLRANDIAINEQLKRFVNDPVLVVIEAEPKELGLPTEAYLEVEEVHDDGTPPLKTFEHVASEIGAEEAEEVGVEHLLRNIKDQTAGTLSQRITDQLVGLRGLGKQLDDVKRYLHDVAQGRMPTNHGIVYDIQEALNLLPDVLAENFIRSQTVGTNDQLVCVYIASLIRTVIAMHSLIDNKLSLQKAEQNKETKKNDDKSDKEKVGKAEEREKKE